MGGGEGWEEQCRFGAYMKRWDDGWVKHKISDRTGFHKVSPYFRGGSLSRPFGGRVAVQSLFLSYI